jgi:hypothetical protein
MHSLHASDSAVRKAYFDASRVVSGCEYVLNSALNFVAGGLVCFEYDGDGCAWHYLAGIWNCWHGCRYFPG